MRIDVRALRESADAVLGKRRQRDPAVAAHVAEHDAERVVSHELVVAIRRHQEGLRTVEAAAEEAKQVDCRLVGPVDVLEDRDRGARLQRVESGGEDLVPRPVDAEAELLGELVQRPERLGREQAVAGAPDDSRLAGSIGGKRPNERRLADPGLAAHEHEAAGAGRSRRQMHRERFEIRAALDQLHGLMLRRTPEA